MRLLLLPTPSNVAPTDRVTGSFCRTSISYSPATRSEIAPSNASVTAAAPPPSRDTSLYASQTAHGSRTRIIAAAMFISGQMISSIHPYSNPITGRSVSPAAALCTTLN